MNRLILILLLAVFPAHMFGQPGCYEDFDSPVLVVPPQDTASPCAIPAVWPQDLENWLSSGGDATFTDVNPVYLSFGDSWDSGTLSTYSLSESGFSLTTFFQFTDECGNYVESEATFSTSCNGSGPFDVCLACTYLSGSIPSPGSLSCEDYGYDALGVCGGDCAADGDNDGICDDIDPCVGSLDALGFCNGECAADVDDDGICDDVDDCVGALDACGICNGSGDIYECGCSDIPDGDCDCNGNQTDALGVCGGDCAADADSDGICDTDEVSGCTDEAACNFNSLATDDDGSCAFAEEGYDCDGNCLDDVNGDGVCDLELSGCTDEMACNYNPDAIEPDGSCLYADAIGACGGDCSADVNGNGICDALDALLCGPGTVFDVATGQCVGTGSACPGELDGNGLIGASDLLIFLGLFGMSCD